VVLPDTLQKYSTSDVAFEFWFSTTNKAAQTLLSAVATNGANLLRIGTQHVTGAVDSTVTIQLGGIVTSINSFRNLTDGKPRHLYVALNNLGQASATAAIYIDGNLVASPTIVSGSITLDSVVLGQAQTSVGGGYNASSAFIGTLDELRIWSKPRLPSQITGDRSLRLTSYEPFLRADYTFDDVANSATALDNAKDSARPANILGWWRGEGNATDIVTGVVGQARNGTVYSNSFDNNRQAFGFDGIDDYINIPNNASQNPSGQITIEAWVYPTASKIALIAGKVNGFQLYTFSNNTVGLFLPGVTTLSSVSALPLNQWSHVAGVYHPFFGGRIAIYINGVQNASSTAPAGPITVSTNPLQIGGLSVPGVFTGAFFQGKIDEVGIYGQALTTFHFVDIYSNGLPHHGIYGDAVGGTGNTAQAPQFVPGLTSVLGNGLLVNSVNGSLRQLAGFSGLAKVYTTATDNFSGTAGFGRTATAIQDVYVGKFTGIYGTKFDDVNGNGIRDAGESGVEGWRIFLDVNGDSIADRSTLTDRNGDYAFTNLPWSATGHSVWQANSPALVETVTRYDGITVNATTHLATYNFGGQQQARIMVTSDGTNGLIPPALEGQIVFLSASANPNLIDPHYQWTIVSEQGAPLTFADPGDSATATFTPLNQGDFLVTVVVSSAPGAPNPYSYTSTTRVIARNVAPILASATPPATWEEGNNLFIDIVSSDIDPLDYIVDFDVNNDGEFDGLSDVHFSQAVGQAIPWSSIVASELGDGTKSYSVRTSVIDNDGGRSSFASFALVLNNASPTVTLASPFPLTEGDSLQLVVNATDPAGTADPLTYAWDLDSDGLFDDAVGANPTLSWQQLIALGIGNGTVSYPIAVRVSDDDGGVSIASDILVVTNRAPTITSIGTGAIVEEGVAVSLTGLITDPSVSDTHTFAWTVTKNGNPYAAGTEPTLNFTPNDQGNYGITLIVTDSDGASDSKSITITAANVAPRATINLPTPLREGANTIQFTSLLDSQADLAAGLLFSIDIGNDGVFEVVDSNQSNVVIVLPDQGQYVLRLRVKDKDGASRDYSRTVTAENAPPTATFELSSAGIINEGAGGLSVRFVGATDPSTADFAVGFTYSYDLDGDGAFEIVGVPANSQPVTFPQDGGYTIRGRIHDRDGGTSEYTLQITVQNVAPQIASFTGAATSNEGSSIAFTGSVADPGSDVLTALARIRRTNVASDPGIEIPVLIAADRTFHFDPIFDADIVGGYDVILVINDGTISSQQSRHVTIDNVTPTIDTQFNATIVAGRNLTRKLSFVDPGKDVWIVKADFGQGLSPIPFDSIKKNFVLDHAFATPGTFTVRAEVFDGIATTLNSFQVEVMPNSAPTVLHPISDKTVTQGIESVSTYVDLTQVFVDSDGPVTELTYTVASNSNAALVATSIATGRLTLSVSPGSIGTATITVRATDVGGLSVDDTFTVTILPAQSLQIRSVSPTNTGVQIEVGTVPDLAALNLYDGVDASLDLADVALIGTNSGKVRGSLLWNASSNTIEFIKTGGLLVADTYTLTLFSRVDGWKTAAGAMLDGDNNGIPGGDLVRTFTVAPTTARIVSIPDFSRGATSTAGQSVNLSYDNGNPGVPVKINDGADVMAVDFDVVYNPALINFTSTFFSVLPANWTTTVN